MHTSHLCFVQAEWRSLSLLVARCTADELLFKVVSSGLAFLSVEETMDVCDKPCRWQKDFSRTKRGMLLAVRLPCVDK